MLNPVEFDAFAHLAFPGLQKVHCADGAEQVNAIWRQPELDDQVFSLKFFGGCDAGDASLPEVGEGGVQFSAIAWSVVIKNIDVAGQPGVSIINDRLATDDHVAYFVTGEPHEEFADIL